MTIHELEHTGENDCDVCNHPEHQKAMRRAYSLYFALASTECPSEVYIALDEIATENLVIIAHIIKEILEDRLKESSSASPN